MTNLSADITVIAGGPAGLTAAVAAAEKGAGVILLEKGKRTGGAANMGMGILGIGTKYQKQFMFQVSVKKALKMFMEYTHYNVDARLIRRYFGMSADTIKWLEGMGVEFYGAFRYFTHSEPTWHIVKSERGVGPGAAMRMNELITKRAEELGVKIMLNTSGIDIRKEDGRVSGVLARGADGEEYDISCKAAVIATGGAGANPEMIREFTGFEFKKDLFSFAVPGCTGDGIRMAWKAGADHMPIRIEQAASLEGIAGLPVSVPNVMGQCNLLVNKFGKRIMDEEDMPNATFLSNAVTHQVDKVAFSIVDSSIVREYIENGVDEISMVRQKWDVSDFAEGVQKAKKNKQSGLYIADTLEELAGLTGIDKEGLLKTVESYNAMCVTGDEEFFKRKDYMRPLVEGPFYAARFRAGGYGTVGGIRINENCEA